MNTDIYIPITIGDKKVSVVGDTENMKFRVTVEGKEKTKVRDCDDFSSVEEYIGMIIFAEIEKNL